MGWCRDFGASLVVGVLVASLMISFLPMDWAIGDEVITFQFSGLFFGIIYGGSCLVRLVTLFPGIWTFQTMKLSFLSVNHFSRWHFIVLTCRNATLVLFRAQSNGFGDDELSYKIKVINLPSIPSKMPEL